MPDSMTTAGLRGVTARGSGEPDSLGNGTQLFTAGMSLGHGERIWGLGGYPWIPALVVGCGMAIFLSLSFYSHHKRVRRKRELLMDYLSILLYSGATARGRSVSVLCNTNSMALSDLGRSFKIKRPRRVSSDSADYLREKYLMDLLTFSDNKKTKALKRFISAPSERKFRRLAGHLIAMNRVTRFGRGGVGTFVRNFSMPDQFDSCELDVPVSLSEAKTNITQGVLLDPNRMSSVNAVKMKRPATVAEPLSNHSYENVAFSDKASLSREAALLKTSQPDDHTKDNNLPLQNIHGEQFCFPQSHPLAWSPNKAPASRTMDEANNSTSSKRGEENLSPTKGMLVSATNCSALSLFNHAIGIPSYSPMVSGFSSSSIVSYSDPFRDVPCTSYPSPEENISRQFSNTHTSVLNDSEQDHSSNYYPFRTIDHSNVHMLKKHTTCAENPKGLDEVSRKCISLNSDSPKECAVTFTKSLEYCVEKSPRRYPIQNGLNSMDFNPLFPGEKHSSISIQNPKSFLPAAFRRQLPTRTVKEQAVSHSVYPVRAPKLASTKMLRSKSVSKTASDTCHFKPKSKRHLSKTMSTQSTKALISKTGNPAQGFSSLDSDPLSPSPTKRFFSLQDGPEIFATSNNCSQMLPRLHVQDDSSWQMIPFPDSPSEAPLTLQPLRLIPWEDRYVSRRVLEPDTSHTDTAFSTESMPPSGSLSEVRQMTNVHRLPRFQARSSMNHPLKLLAKHDVVRVLDETVGNPDMESDDSLWISRPMDTRI